MNLTGTETIIAGLSRLSVSHFSEAAYIAARTVDYTKALGAGQITKAQFADLIADLHVDALVAMTADEEDVKSALMSLMSNLLALLQAIAPAL